VTGVQTCALPIYHEIGLGGRAGRREPVPDQGGDDLVGVDGVLGTAEGLDPEALLVARSAEVRRSHDRPRVPLAMSTPSVWCPACGAEYTVGSRYCNECRVELVVEPPAFVDGGSALDDDDGDEAGDATDLVELGEFPRLHAQILRRRLETAGLSVMVEWSGPGGSALGTILVPDSQAEFAEAVINEIEVDDEVPDSSPEAYIARIEEHLGAVGALLDELRTRLEQAEPEP